jgi:hypothetical protein
VFIIRKIVQAALWYFMMHLYKQSGRRKDVFDTKHVEDNIAELNLLGSFVFTNFTALERLNHAFSWSSFVSLFLKITLPAVCYSTFSL